MSLSSVTALLAMPIEKPWTRTIGRRPWDADRSPAEREVCLL